MKVKQRGSFIAYLSWLLYVPLRLLSPQCPLFPTTIVQKVTLHIEKIKANFDDTLNFLNYATMSLSSTNNDTYTDVKECVQVMVQDFTLVNQEIIGP